MIDLAQVAAVPFDAMASLDIQSKPTFLENASNVYDTLNLAVGMFAKGPEHLAAGFRAVTAEAGDNGEAALAVVGEISEAKDWLSGYAKVLGAMEARCLVALARVAVEQPA